MPEFFHVHLNKELLVFSAAHFITYAGKICERLHGHNYRVAAEVQGPLDANHYVVDFIALREGLKNLVDQLDHRVLLPTLHPLIHVTADAQEVTARFENRRWVFPLDDCVLLPVANTTAELLARYLGEKLEPLLVQAGLVALQRLKVAVDENHGQWGVWEKTFDRR